MTDAPDLEPAEAEMTDAEIERWAEVCNHDLARKALRHYIALRLAARSAPEAGKAVDAARQLPAVEVMPADTLPSGDEYLISKAFVHEGAIIALYGTNDKLIGWIDTNAWTKGRVYRDRLLPLASSPAPTGAEPVAPTGEIAGLVDELIGWAYRDKQWDANRWHLCASDTKPRPHEGREIQAVYLAATLTRLSAMHRDMCAVAGRLEDRLTASEAEAADLRRKLEEHQDAEDKAAREMATVIQGLRNRATAAERKLEERDKRIAKLEADLAFADEQSAKVEALLEPHVQWECASEGCGKPATVHFVRGDVGSWYCRDCYMRTQAIPAGRTALESDNG